MAGGGTAATGGAVSPLFKLGDVAAGELAEDLAGAGVALVLLAVPMELVGKAGGGTADTGAGVSRSLA